MTVIAMEAEDIAVALRNTPGHTRHDDHAWRCTEESLRKVAEYCRQRMGQGRLLWFRDRGSYRAGPRTFMFVVLQCTAKRCK